MVWDAAYCRILCKEHVLLRAREQEDDTLQAVTKDKRNSTPQREDTFFFREVFSHSRVTGACPVTMDLIMRRAN